MAYSELIIKEVQHLLSENVAVTEICSRLNLPKSTVYKWRKKYLEQQAANKEKAKEKAKEKEKLQKMLNFLIENNRLLEALELSEIPVFQDDPEIQAYRINILVKLNRDEEALAISRNPAFQDDFVIQSMRDTLLRELGETEGTLNTDEIVKPQTQNNGGQKHINPNQIVNNLLNKIKNHTILEESSITTAAIPKWQKVILISALHDISNYPMQLALNYLKRQSAEYEEEPEVLKIIRKLLLHAKTKKRIFDTKFYQELLKRPITIGSSELDDSSSKEKPFIIRPIDNPQKNPTDLNN